MFQSFEVTAEPGKGPGRLAALRGEMARAGVQGFIVPRADMHQGEYVAEADARLAWLTGFTGSAGFCIALEAEAGVFVDGRYRAQVRAQVDLAAFTPVDWPEVKPGDWLRERLGGGVQDGEKDGARETLRVGFDAWLHTAGEIAAIEAALEGSGVTLVATDNLVDRIWDDRPAPPAAPIRVQPLAQAGVAHGDKRAELAAGLRAARARAAVLTLSDSIAWLLNIRGSDIPHIPVVQGLAILHDDARVDLFTNPARGGAPAGHFDAAVRLCPDSGFDDALVSLEGPVQVDKATAPLAISRMLEAAGIEVAWGDDPCILPKARKNATELAGARAAHLRDGAALVEFLTWFDATAPAGALTEIDLVTELESQRRATGALKDISFETIAGSGPNGAIIHYRVTRETNRTLARGDLVVLDSGGQYADGTTDITRTLPVGPVGRTEAEAFTRVLQGMIAVSRVRLPKGATGRELDPLARAPLWVDHLDYNHGTGHGVGSYLSVHEGPQRISRASDVVLEPGMIVSNEPGYYRDGAFGIRIENLIAVTEASRPEGGDDREMLAFETLAFVPIDRRLIVAERLGPGERAWLNAYHGEVYEKIAPLVSEPARAWLQQACAPI